MKKAECETCEFKGYSPEVCKRHTARGAGPGCDQDVRVGGGRYRNIGKALAVGAGAGAAVTFAWIAVAPIIGFKAVIGLGHAIAAKITMGGGVAGAGVNIARKMKKGESKNRRTKRKALVLPMYLKG